MAVNLDVKTSIDSRLKFILFFGSFFSLTLIVVGVIMFLIGSGTSIQYINSQPIKETSYKIALMLMGTVVIVGGICIFLSLINRKEHPESEKNTPSTELKKNNNYINPQQTIEAIQRTEERYFLHNI